MDSRGLQPTVETWYDSALKHMEALGKAFAMFRQHLRGVLAENGVPSNPGWSEDDIVEAFRKLLRDKKT